MTHALLDPERETVFLPIEGRPQDVGSAGLGLFRLVQALERIRHDPSEGVDDQETIGSENTTRSWDLGDEAVRITQADHGDAVEFVVSLLSDRRDDGFVVAVWDVTTFGTRTANDVLVACALEAVALSERALGQLALCDPDAELRADEAFTLAEGAAWRQIDMTAPAEVAARVVSLEIVGATPWSSTIVGCRDADGAHIGGLLRTDPILASLARAPAVVVVRAMRNRIELLPTTRIRSPDAIGRLRSDLAYARFMEAGPEGPPPPPAAA